jgi:hypothetical protein
MSAVRNSDVIMGVKRTSTGLNLSPNTKYDAHLKKRWNTLDTSYDLYFDDDRILICSSDPYGNHGTNACIGYHEPNFALKTIETVERLMTAKPRLYQCIDGEWVCRELT